MSDVTLLSQSKMKLAWSSPAPAPAPSPEQAGVMARLRTGRDPWEQLGLPRSASRYRDCAVSLAIVSYRKQSNT